MEAFGRAKEAGHGASLLVKDGKGTALATFIHDDARWNGRPYRVVARGNINIEILSVITKTQFENLHGRSAYPKAQPTVV